MAKYLLGIITGIFLCIFFVVMLALAAALISSRPPSVADGSTLLLDLNGEIVERNPSNVPSFLLQHAFNPTVKDIHDILQKAAADRRVSAVFFKPGRVELGWAKAQEIRGDLEAFKKSNKPLIAFLQTADMRTYYMATAADRIFMPDEGELDVKGMRAEAVFFKDTFDKLGVQVEMEHIGKYKSFYEPFTRDKMSDAYREVTNSILDTVMQDFLTTVAARRHMSVADLRTTLDQGPFLPQEALKARLIDGLLYEDQVLNEIKKLTGGTAVKRLRSDDYNHISLESLGLAGGSKIALVYATGAIFQGGDQIDPLSGGDGIGGDSFSHILRDVGNDTSVKGVIVRIDSPGGDAIASDQIWKQMNDLRAKKPMVISMSDVAASGGYYMAMADAPILAYPETYTGSIGVVLGKANLHGLYDKIGLTKDILTRGEFADIDSDYHSFTPAEREKVVSGMTAVYRDFVQKVADSRHKKWQQIDDIAQGRVWMGVQGKENGLVDELGGIDRAIALVKQRAKLKPEDKITLVSYPPEKKLLDILMSRFNGLSGEDEVRRLFQIPSSAADYFRIVLDGALRGRMLHVAPYWITVQ